VLIEAGEDFDVGGDGHFYVRHVLRGVEVQGLAQKTRDRRVVLRGIERRGRLNEEEAVVEPSGRVSRSGSVSPLGEKTRRQDYWQCPSGATCGN
jgi:hypothetical protein